MNQVQANDGDSCENDWLQNSGQFVNKERPDYRGLLAYWQQKADQCSGTVAYEARLAAIHLYLDDQPKARVLLAAVKKKPSKYQNLVELTELIAESFALADASPTNEAHLKEFGQRVLEFTRRYPAFSEGLAFAGGVQTTLGNHAQAIPLLEKAFSLADKRMSTAGLYRNAAISYAALGDYTGAFNASGAAASENKALYADPAFMYAVLKAETELGMLKDAETAAWLLSNKTPAVKEDPEFQALIENLQRKIRDAKR